MNAHGWWPGLVEVAVGRGAPGSLPRRPRWLRQYGQPILVLVTLALCLAARASVLPSGWPNQAVAILGVLPLALFPVAPLAAWRVGFVAMILSEPYGAPHETAHREPIPNADVRLPHVDPAARAGDRLAGHGIRSDRVDLVDLASPARTRGSAAVGGSARKG
jgi:hypothetical protein